MIQHWAACFLLSKPWRRNHRDSITDMLVTLNWQTLEERTKQSCLMLMFKFMNNLIHVPDQYLPFLFCATSTRANYPLNSCTSMPGLTDTEIYFTSNSGTVW